MNQICERVAKPGKQPADEVDGEHLPFILCCIPWHNWHLLYFPERRPSHHPHMLTTIPHLTLCCRDHSDEGRLVHDLVEDVLRINHVLSIEERQTSIPYDVFINHRGTDVKNTLASHLYYRLQSNGLRVFFDKEEAQKGHTVNSEVENAIKVASVHIAIFSRRFAESEWCMDELLLMVKSQSVIIPVFYDVKPSDIMLLSSVDEMNGVYAKALHILGNEKTFDPQTHEAKPRYGSETIEIWKGVLMEVTKRDGFQLETYDGDEGELVDNVVLEVDKQVKQKQR